MNTGKPYSPHSPNGFAFTLGGNSHDHIYNPRYPPDIFRLTWGSVWDRVIGLTEITIR